MRLVPNLRLRGGTVPLVPFLLLTLSCARDGGRTVPVVEASVLTAVLIGGPLLVAAVAVVALFRRRRGPEPLSRLLLAGSLRDMQRPRPYRRGAEP